MESPPVGVPRPRPRVGEITGHAEYFQVTAEHWVVIVWDLIPKNGFGHLLFPHLWGAPAQQTRWRVARHGELPGDTFLFDSREHAESVVREVFPRGGRIPMGRIEVPSDDHRRSGRWSDAS